MARHTCLQTLDDLGQCGWDVSMSKPWPIVCPPALPSTSDRDGIPRLSSRLATDIMANVRAIEGSVWRLILSPPLSGPENMALDEAILESVVSGATLPTLRFYAWEPPCLSLGYAQPSSQVWRDELSRAGWDLVRRPTGGRAILHTDELTYMVAGPAANPFLGEGILPTYHRLSQALVAGLVLLGLRPTVQLASTASDLERSNPVCFEAPSSYEITIHGRKLLGSAQSRRQGGVLQHGSLPLSGDLSRICRVLNFTDQTARQQAMKRLLERAITVEQALGQPVGWQRAAEALAQGFEQALGWQLRQSGPTAKEGQRAKELAASRYANEAWTMRL